MAAVKITSREKKPLLSSSFPVALILIVMSKLFDDSSREREF